MSVKPASSVLRRSSIRHKNQENTLLPFLLHTSVTAGSQHAPRTYSAIRPGTFSRRYRGGVTTSTCWYRRWSS
jgi:hypothetical protein